MVKELLATQKKTGAVKRALQQLHFSMWLLFQRRSQVVRIKKAYKIMKQINRPAFQDHPPRLFSYIRKIDPFVFEELLLLSFKARGIKVVHNKRYTGDGGIDGILILENNKRYAIQAKRYSHTINPSHISHFKQAIITNGCHSGFFIHCGKSTPGLYRNLDPSIYLISGNNLHQLLTKAFH